MCREGVKSETMRSEHWVRVTDNIMERKRSPDSEYALEFALKFATCTQWRQHLAGMHLTMNTFTLINIFMIYYENTLTNTYNTCLLPTY